jgi:RNA polymerase sigma-70 factor, ECF subfamily
LAASGKGANRRKVAPVAGGSLDDGAYFSTVLSALRAGEPWAAEVIFGQLHHRLLRFAQARARAGATGDADDVVAEVWEAVAARVARFEGDWPEFRAWVFVIARRRLIEHGRRAARRRTDPYGDDVFADLEAGARPDVEVADRDATSVAVATIQRHLPEDQADVVLLRVLGELGVSEVAAVMGRTETWVRVTQHRALRRLAARLGTEAVSGAVWRTV